MSEIIDIGHGHTIQTVGWHPDRALNPQYADVPDIEIASIVIEHPNAKSAEWPRCVSAVQIDTPEVARIFPDERSRWQLVSADPLTLAPSLLCMRCGDHGFIQNGRWVPA